MDHQKSSGIVSKTLTSPFSSLRPIFIPWVVVTVNTISFQGYFRPIALTRGIAEMTSPTDRACIHIVPFLGGVLGKFRPSLSRIRRLFANEMMERGKMKMEVHAKW